MTTVRAFVAIDLNDAIRGRIERLQERLRRAGLKLGWVRPDNIHLTMKFLGDLEDHRAANVSNALAELAAATSAFELHVEGVGAFPPRGVVRVVWVGVADPARRLAECQARCESLLTRAGFAPERRPFAPHLTIARCRVAKLSGQIRKLIERHGDVDGGRLAVARVALYRSVLSPAGSQYTVLSEHSLAP